MFGNFNNNTKTRSRRHSPFRSTTFLTIVLALGVYLFVTMIGNPAGENIDGSFKVHFVDVGQGDCILIETPDNEFMLIDTGEKDEYPKLDAYLKNLNITAFQYVIFTHPHADHIGGASEIVKNYDIETLIMPNVTHTTKTFTNLIDAIEEKGLQITPAIAGDEYNLGEARFMVVAPLSEKYENLNNYSVVIKMIYRDTSYLFTGDMEKEGEQEILEYSRENNSDLSCDILKVGHHGSNTSSSESFINLINPKIAVILCGVNNSYNHPHSEVISRLEINSIEIVRTDLEGNIVISTNGREYTISTQNNTRGKTTNE